MRYEFGLPWRILSGEEEGSLAFRGGTSWPVVEDGAGAPARRPAALTAPPGPLLLVDIGGGSTEFAVGSAGEPPAFVRSLDVGVVRLTERFFHADPPPAAEVAALAGHVAAAIRRPCRRSSAPRCAARWASPAPTPRLSPTSSA